MVKEIIGKREDSYKKLVERNLAGTGAKVLKTYWLINAVLAEVKLSPKIISMLAKREDVLYVESRYSGEKPPSDPDPLNDLFEARAEIGSDNYFNLGLTGGSISLLDTGIRSSHTLFNGPSNLGLLRDCINGGDDCNTGVLDLVNHWNHGTQSASILCGNSNLGPRFRGVTNFTVDSFKVYTPPPGGLDRDVAETAFSVSTALLNRVIVAEIQDIGDDNSTLARSAESGV